MVYQTARLCTKTEISFIVELLFEDAEVNPGCTTLSTGNSRALFKQVLAAKWRNNIYQEVVVIPILISPIYIHNTFMNAELVIVVLYTDWIDKRNKKPDTGFNVVGDRCMVTLEFV